MVQSRSTIAQQTCGIEEPEYEDKLITDGWMKFRNVRWGMITDVLISHRKVDLEDSVGLGDELIAAIDRYFGISGESYGATLYFSKSTY